MPIHDIDNAIFEELKVKAETYQRACGYYLIRYVRYERGKYADWDECLDAIFEYCDDVKWTKPPDAAGNSQSWESQECSEEQARDEVTTGLIGGGNVGHSGDTIRPAIAAEIWTRFHRLFSADARYYRRLGLGDPKYVFSTGVGIVDKTRAGVLMVIEND